MTGAIVRGLQGVKGERNFPLAKYTRVKPGYCLLNQRNRSRPCGQPRPPHHKCLDTHAENFFSWVLISHKLTFYNDYICREQNSDAQKPEGRTELLALVFFELALALICLIRITPTCYSTAIIKRLRNTQVTWSPLCITC